MKIGSVNEALKKVFAYIIIRNELGDDIDLAYEFSDPDGVRSGKSGWSFGIVQHDINNNPNALLALKEMDFTTDEVGLLKRQDSPDAPKFMTRMNTKLLAHRDIVDRWDARQIQECLEWSLKLCNEIGVEFSKTETLLHCADYHNQFSMSRGGKLYTWLKEQRQSVTPEMVRDFKLSLKWGKDRPEDVLRRYGNIARIAARTMK